MNFIIYFLKYKMEKIVNLFTLNNNIYKYLFNKVKISLIEYLNILFSQKNFFRLFHLLLKKYIYIFN